MKLTMLTTIDNPFSPFDEYDAWYAYDQYAGYKTTEYLARVTPTSHELSENDYNLVVTTAIDEIVKENVLGIYLKVEKEVPD